MGAISRSDSSCKEHKQIDRWLGRVNTTNRRMVVGAKSTVKVGGDLDNPGLSHEPSDPELVRLDRQRGAKPKPPH